MQEEVAVGRDCSDQTEKAGRVMKWSSLKEEIRRTNESRSGKGSGQVMAERRVKRSVCGPAPSHGRASNDRRQNKWERRKQPEAKDENRPEGQPGGEHAPMQRTQKKVNRAATLHHDRALAPSVRSESASAAS